MFGAVTKRLLRYSETTVAILEDLPLWRQNRERYYDMNRSSEVYAASQGVEWFGKRAGCTFIREGCYQYIQEQIELNGKTTFVEGIILEPLNAQLRPGLSVLHAESGVLESNAEEQTGQHSNVRR